jgi:hypothetical protein
LVTGLIAFLTRLLDKKADRHGAGSSEQRLPQFPAERFLISVRGRRQEQEARQGLLVARSVCRYDRAT